MRKIPGVVSHVVTLGVAAVVGAAGLVSVGATGTADAARNFYTPPSKYDSTPGSVIRTEHSDLLLQLPGLKGQWPGTATRMMYTSTLQGGKPIAVTGTVVEPTARWTGKGERPTVVIGEGTVGQGDQCAPSKMMNFPVSVDPGKPGIGVNYTGPEMYLMLINGVRVVIPDYVGLGTPGVHAYINRAESGHAMLDAARAGLRIAKAPKDAPVAFSGYSQGGGASASAAELAQTYAPDINVKATYAGAPPANLGGVVNQLDGSAIVGAIAYVLNGLEPRYPELGPILDKELNAKGKRILRRAATQCIPETALETGLQHTREWTRTGESLKSLINRTPALKRALDDQLIGKRKPNAPVLVSIGVNDDIVPPGQVRTMYQSWRRQGATVHVSRDYTPPTVPGLVINHAIPLIVKLLPAAKFLINEFNR